MAIDGGLWAEISSHLRHWHWQRIETGGTGRGIPDANGCSESCEVWLELKATEGWKPVIRPEQIGWAERRTRAGGRVFLLTRRRCSAGPRRRSADELWVHRGADVRHVSDGGLRSVSPILMCDGGPSSWNWDLLDGTLRFAKL